MWVLLPIVATPTGGSAEPTANPPAAVTAAEPREAGSTHAAVAGDAGAEDAQKMETGSVVTFDLKDGLQTGPVVGPDSDASGFQQRRGELRDDRGGSVQRPPRSSTSTDLCSTAVNSLHSALRINCECFGTSLNIYCTHRKE